MPATFPTLDRWHWGRTEPWGSRREGNVYAVSDANGDGRADATRTIASGLPMPSGIAFRDGALYVAALSRMLRYDDIEALPDGSLLVSDDEQGTIYRISYEQ